MEYERAGYTIDQYVDGFQETSVGLVPRVATTLSTKDHLGTFGTRTGFTRNNYKVTPGLYCTGDPSALSPVLVTANYKLSFDAVRKELANLDCWILVIDTRGINVWCAAGKGTFSVDEINFQITRCKLDQVVSHREIILPQLGATGVAAHKLKKMSGFRAKYGPILSSKLPEYLHQEGKADSSMRTVSFTLSERAVLLPLEICMLWKQLLIISVLFIVLSGISPEIYSGAAAFSRGLKIILGTITAVVAGAVVTPLLLPWIPFRQFWIKGALVGAICAGLLFSLCNLDLSGIEHAGLFLWITSCASFLAMNFTGSTPFTSLSGVEKEMRKGLPFQIICSAVGLILWLAAPFINFT